MNPSNIAFQAAPSPGAWRSSSVMFASREVERTALEPSGNVDAVGSSVLRYSTPRRSSSSFSSAYAGEPVKSGCQDASTSWVKPGAVRSVEVRMQPPSWSLRSRTQTLQPAFESSAAHASELIPAPTKTASNWAIGRD
jgi:hypothetical protein